MSSLRLSLLRQSATLHVVRDGVTSGKETVKARKGKTTHTANVSQGALVRLWKTIAEEPTLNVG